MDAGLSSDCRCPHTHLTLKQSDPYYCQASDGSEMKRLNTVFFSPEKLVGSDDSTRWAGPDSGNFTLTVDLQNTYQVRTVFFVCRVQQIPFVITLKCIVLRLPANQAKRRP